MDEILNIIIKLVAALLAFGVGWLVKYLISLLRSKLDENGAEKLDLFIAELVAAAEQLYKQQDPDGTVRLRYVQDMLIEAGYEMTDAIRISILVVPLVTVLLQSCDNGLPVVVPKLIADKRVDGNFKKVAISVISSSSGVAAPRSHLDTAAKVTPKASASCSWVMERSFRSLLMFEERDNFIFCTSVFVIAFIIQQNPKQ